MDTYTLSHFSFAYPEQARPALSDISLTIERGQFVTLVGKSGSGKTTLLRQLKPALAAHGVRTGSILFEGTEIGRLSHRDQSAKIGFVLQSPENQIVTDKVWHELAFGLESLGLSTPVIRLRVAEMAAFFGIEDWFCRDVAQLSGGQKQLLNLAGIMAMQPSVLILDEPTSQLDPIAASDFLAAVARINRELGTTVLLTEHRLEDALPLSDRMLVLEEGRIIGDGPPSAVGQALRQQGHDMFLAMPTPMRVYAAVPSDLPCPITVRQGRDWLDAFAQAHPLAPVPHQPEAPAGAPAAMTLKDVWFRYQQDTPDVLQGLSLTVPQGSLFALMGGNGAGKSTVLSLLSGVNRPQRGTLRLEGQPLGALPQNPQALFVKSTVALDLAEALDGSPLTPAQRQEKIDAVAALCELGPLLDRHPYDLSGGEQQRAALAKVLLPGPRLLLLDEPTKGLDAYFKEKLAGILRQLRDAGTTVLMVSHDVAFCARHASHCALMFGGDVVSCGTPQAFFSGNTFYTTAANRMARDHLPGAVTAEDIISACGAQPPVQTPSAPLPHIPSTAAAEALPGGQPPPAKPLPLWRKVLGGACLLACAALVWWMLRAMPLTGLGDLLPGLSGGMGYALPVLAAALLAAAGAALLTRRAPPPPQAPLALPRGSRLPRRTLVAAAVILLLIPLTLYVGIFYLGGRRYYFISLLIVLETMLPFFMIFESRKPQARELAVLATLCALAVAGRAAFFFLPQFKPVAALVIISAVAFGGESGFLVGALSMLVSNMFFGQGPYTPFQMFAMGIIGFLAGVLFRKGVLRRSRVALCAYGGLSVFFIYGFVMNTYTVFQTQAGLSWGMLLSAWAVGIPMDLVHAASTVFFLWVAGPAVLEKLDRIKTKYGLMS